MHILRIFSRPFESMYGPNERCHRPKPLISQPLGLTLNGENNSLCERER